MKEGNDIAIRVSGLSKKYRLGEASLGDIFNPFSFFKKKQSIEDNKEFYALKDVSFEIKKGEAVGIIGRNGAGKSTLLKILSRVTEPTEGKVEIFGTVASVLEVGMGFHPELTGRENVYLSGTMLGIPKKKIAEKFDEIVEFAGVEKFIDTPVKHYSSGMYVRLAFSVVTNIDADILLFDEVLSVGDLAFQMKCGEKIRELIEKKKTILLASHNMNDIINSCSRSFLIHNGKIDIKDSHNNIKQYFNNASQSNDNLFLESNNKTIKYKNITSKKWIEDNAPGDNNLKIIKVWMETSANSDPKEIYCNDEININIEYLKYNSYDFYDIVLIFSTNNMQFLACHLFNSNLSKKIIDKGNYIISAKFPSDFFSDIPISLNLSIFNNRGFCHFERNVLRFKCIMSEIKAEYYSQLPDNICPILPKINWEYKKIRP